MKKNKLDHIKNNDVCFAFAKAILLTTILFLVSCDKKQYQLEKVTGNQVSVDSTSNSVAALEDFIAPYKKSLDAQMNEQLSYNPVDMYKNDFKYNTPIGNMLANIVKTQGDVVYTARTGKNIDLVILNHGGIRAGMPAGPVTMRSAYEVMPFDNEIIVAQLNSNQMNDLIQYLIDGKRAHPIEGVEILVNKDGTLASALVNNQPIDIDRTYAVATSDYLYSGGDNMSFFKDTPAIKLDYKIRNAMIDYFKKVDTLRFKRDNRFNILN